MYKTIFKLVYVILVPADTNIQLSVVRNIQYFDNILCIQNFPFIFYSQVNHTETQKWIYDWQ